jgi:hypothetical protein
MVHQKRTVVLFCTKIQQKIKPLGQARVNQGHQPPQQAANAGAL